MDKTIKSVTPFEYALDEYIHNFQIKENLKVTIDLSKKRAMTNKEVVELRERNILNTLSRIRIK